MVPTTTFLTVLAAFGATAIASRLPERDDATANMTTTTTDSMDIEVNKYVDATSGNGSVSAYGVLTPFDGVGIGCGVNWEKDVSFGGGLQAGTKDFGLGGGYTIFANGTLNLGAGIGLPSANASANINLSADKDGAFQLQFQSSSPISCQPGPTVDGKTSVVCTVGGS